MRLLIAALILALTHSAAYAETIAGRAAVIDGDTLEIHGERIRLHGIDAPELDQVCQDETGADYPCGAASRAMLTALTGPLGITCEGTERDRYGRLLARCWDISGNNIGSDMVREGWAVAFTRYSRDYVGEESAAKALKEGLWAGTFVMPWEWRKAN